MDKSCHSSGESNTNSTATTGTSNNSNSNRDRDQYLKHLNKLSHKISKQPSTLSTASAPIIKKPPPPPPAFDNQPQSQSQQNLQPPPPPPQHQPPVYNINKNDFRDVVQKLTGSPAHERFSTPPPIQQPKAPSSRLQRIRPPPLAQLNNRPPPGLSCANPPNQTVPAPGFMQQRPIAPLSPLPPLPAVHAAAESPVSAYMRYLQNPNLTADTNLKQQFSGFSPLAPLISPRWNSVNAAAQQQQQQSQEMISQPAPASSQPQFQLPTTPLPFGCLNSPPMMSPGMLFPPSSPQLSFPLSPTVPVPSPRWRGI